MTVANANDTMVETKAKRAHEEDLEVWVYLSPFSLQGPEKAKAEIAKPSPLISEEQKFWTAASEPPDINLRYILAADQEWIKRLHEGRFDDDFVSKILKYRQLDLDLEVGLLFEYQEWIEGKQEVATEMGLGREAAFLQGLHGVVKKHADVVEEEEEEEEAAANVFAARRKAVREAEQLAFWSPLRPVSMSLGPASVPEIPAVCVPDSDTDSSSYVTAKEASSFFKHLE